MLKNYLMWKGCIILHGVTSQGVDRYPNLGLVSLQDIAARLTHLKHTAHQVGGWGEGGRTQSSFNQSIKKCSRSVPDATFCSPGPGSSKNKLITFSLSNTS